MSHDTSPLPSASAISPVVKATLSLDGFIDGWRHCHELADYLARFAASDRFDPAQLTTRLSTYLNEVLELLFHTHKQAPAAHGHVVIEIRRQADRLYVEIAVPTADDNPLLRETLRQAVTSASPEDYRREFLEPQAAACGTSAGLRELVALHGIAIELRETDTTFTLRLTVPHE